MLLNSPADQNFSTQHKAARKSVCGCVCIHAYVCAVEATR